MRVTADTNVLVSALNFPGSKPYQLLELARWSGAIDLAISGHILDELKTFCGASSGGPTATSARCEGNSGCSHSTSSTLMLWM